MPFFQPALSPQLFFGQTAEGDLGKVVAVLPPPNTSAGFEIADAIGSQALNASLVFLQSFAGNTAAEQQQFVEAVVKAVAPTPSQKAMLWVASDTALIAGAQPISLTALAWSIPANNPITNGPLIVNVGPTLSLNVAAGIGLQASGTDLVLSGMPVTFTGLSAPLNPSGVTVATIPFAGPNLGCVEFQVNIPQTSLANQLNLGFEYFIPPATDSGTLALQVPFATPNGGSSPGFNASFDPLDPFNQVSPTRTALVFTGFDPGGGTTAFVSCFTTASGQPITLTPISKPAQGETAAALVFTNANQNLQTATPEFFAATPQGDFVLSTPGSNSTETLLCGLQGAEYLVFQPAGETYAGDRLRFVANQAAYGPTLPLPIASPVLPPASSTLLDDTYVTSWATLLPAIETNTISSVAQPPGFNLFGHDTTIYGHNTNLQGGVDPATILQAEPATVYPLIPYSNVQGGDGVLFFSLPQIQEFENQVIGPIRRSVLTSLAAGGSLSARGRSFQRQSEDPSPIPRIVNASVTTPSGFLVELQESESQVVWTEIILGQILETDQTFGFLQPGLALQQAFQTGQLFLVVANADDLGTLGGSSGPSFANSLSMGGWTLTAGVGEGSSFADYANVMIVKGMPGKLFDPDQNSASLVANPAKWTQASQFAAPVTGQSITPDPTQLVNLSQWLQNYFQQAWTNPDTYYFNDFNTIATDPNWTGIIVLKGQITQIPSGLNGIMAGISDPSAFNAHHLAIAVSPVKDGPDGPVVSQSSSVYGLVYYLDPSADPANPANPLPGQGNGDYDFRLLSLKVLFENTAVKSFSSYAQITLKKLLGTSVSSMGAGGNPYEAVVLQGTYQLVDNQPIYSLASMADSVFLMTSNVLNRVEITGVTMSTVQADPAGASISVFSMTGFLDFALVPGNDSPIDLFSFGNQSGADLGFQGLSFGGLLLTLSYPTQTPQARTLVLSADQIQFDLQTSTIRPNSLVPSLGLTVRQLVHGTDSATLAQFGYLPVTLDFRSNSLGVEWYGLDLALNLGTPGALASSAGFVASVVLAWSTQTSGANFGIQVGLNLPGTAQGAPLISIQNVLKLSIGQTKLTYLTQGSAYLLMLNEIALSFMSFLKLPPNGSSSFYLFGGPSGAGDGLGWFAAYNNEPASSSQTSANSLPSREGSHVL